MSETAKKAIPAGSWLNLSSTVGSQARIYNSGNSILIYVKSISQPGDSSTEGNRINEDSHFDYSIDNGESLWITSVKKNGIASVTPLVTDLVSVKSIDGTLIDTAGRLRTSEPFGILEFKNVITRNRNQFEEIISGLILEYNTLVGGPFTASEEVRGTGELVPLATINTDNGSSSMNLDCDHNDFEVGMTITGQTSGATAVLTSIDTGSNIAHNYDHASVDLTVGVGAADFAIRQTHRPAPYVAGKSQFPTLTMKLPAKKANVLQRVGAFDGLDGIFLESTETDTAFVIRSSTSGVAVDTRIPQNEWTLDRLDGGVSNGPNPSGVTLDISKVQYVGSPFLWQGVGPIFLGLMIDNTFTYCTEVKTANLSDVPYMRNPSLPIRYEIRNTGVPASPTTMEEICSTVSSEGGFTLPGLEFGASRGIAAKTIDNTLQPVFAIRLKNEFPTGKANRRVAKFLQSSIVAATNDIYVEVRHVHDPIDITATWTDVAGGSGMEYSTDISAVTGRPSHVINPDYVPTAAANKAQKGDISAEFINLHSFISQSFDSDNSELFVIYAQAFTGNADVRASMSWVEFD